ncbi:MAG: hypothetical protein RL215_2573 [Planctomycetota bacterium]
MGSSEDAGFPIGLSGLLSELAEGELICFEEQVIEEADFAIDTRDRVNEIGEFEECGDAEVEPIERGDSGGECVPCLSAEFIGRG